MATEATSPTTSSEEGMLLRTVWGNGGMSLRKVTSLGSNLASVTDLKRIQTPHSLCCDFGGDQAAEFKFQV